MNNTELIKYWFGNHDISIFSIYICSLLIVENSYEVHKVSDKEDYIDTTIRLALSTLLKDKRINAEQKHMYWKQLHNDQILFNHMKGMVIDLTNNPNLLQKEKFSPRNKVLDVTNKCFHCKKRHQ